MYSYEYSKTYGALVGINGGKNPDPEQDTEIFIRAIKRLEDEGLSRPDGVVCILVVDSDYPRPNSIVRRRLAEARKTARGTVRFSLVTSSRLARGVVLTMDWINPPPPNYESSVHATFDEAVLWMEQKRGQKLPILYRLYESARAKMEKE